MLQFWKKSGQKETSRSNSISLASSIPQTSPQHMYINGCTYKTNSFDGVQSGPPVPLEDEGLFDIGETNPPKRHSRLTRTLTEIFTDKSALRYFSQYLESRGALQYLHCWLDIESLKEDVQSSHKSPIKDYEVTSNHLSPTLSTKIDHDSLSVSTDCDSYTADSSSLCDYSTCTISESKHLDSKISPCDRVKNSGELCDRNSSDTSRKVKSSCSDGCGDERERTYNKNLQFLMDEAVKIFKNYISLEASESINCPEELRKQIIENICSTEKLLEPNCFERVQNYVYNTLEKEYFNAFLGSDFFCKHQIDMLTSGDIVLEDILYNETALFYFMEFLEQENHRSLLEFWIAASNFQQQLQDQKEFFDSVEAQGDAVVLYDKYISLQAHCPLGFSDKIRFSVEQSICGEDGIMIDCFHLPLKVVEQVLEKNYLKPFIASQLFYKFLSELINAVQTNGCNSIFDGAKHSPSDCSSEKSFSTNSTFLAMELPRWSQKSKSSKGANMNIDTRQLYDPDSLWKRKKCHRLSLGRVTALGKYETYFEPEPDKSSRSMLKDVMKKFVSLDEDKKKEEMAWQVAEMIVRDITNVTLNDCKTSQS